MAKSHKHQKANPVRVQAASLKEKGSSVPNFNFDKWFPYIVSLFALLLYINTINHAYVLDDDTVMAKNTIVTKGIRAIPEILTTAYSKGGMHVEDNMYRPLSLIMFAAEWQIAPNTPFISHLMNVLLYMLTGYLLYKLLRRWLQKKHPIVIVAITLFFIAHPLHTEVVANIKSRDELLAFLFSILSLNAFFLFASESSGVKSKYLLTGTLFFFLALLSKESAITIFAIIPLSVYFFTDKPAKQKYIYTISVLSVTIIIYFMIRIILIGNITLNSNTSIDVFHNSLAGIDNTFIRCCNALVMITYYIRLFLFPHPLSYDYSFNTFPTVSLLNLHFILSFLLIILLVAYAIKNVRKKDAITFGILFFGITLSVVSNIFILIGANFAERFVYLPSLGLSIAVVLATEKATSFQIKKGISFSEVIGSNKIFSGILLCVLVLLSLKTISRNADWKDDLTLFNADKANNPNSFRTFKNYADVLFNKMILLPVNDPQRVSYFIDAKESLTKSITITDQNYESWNSLGKLLSESNDMNDFKNGIDALYKSLKLNNNNAETWFVLGKIYSKTAVYDSAITSFQKALNLNPNLFILTYSQIGIGESYMALKQFDKAIVALEQSLKYDHTNPACYYSIGSCYAQSGNFNKAIEIFNKIENLTVDLSIKSSTYNNTGMCYLNLKQYQEALVYFQKVLNIYPADKAALSNMVITYTNLGNTLKAQEYAAKLQSIP